MNKFRGLTDINFSSVTRSQQHEEAKIVYIQLLLATKRLNN